MTEIAQEREFHYTRADFERLRRLLYQRAGINLADSKEQMVYSRLSRRLRHLGLSGFGSYCDTLERDVQEWQQFVNALTTNLTAFFREGHHFEQLAAYLRQHAQARRTLRIWCAASSTGEEPYSLAMTCMEALPGQQPNWEIDAGLDIIFCRNVMIYFDKPTQHRLLERMVALLRPDGLFFAGHSESFIQAGDLVTLIGRTVYRPATRHA